MRKLKEFTIPFVGLKLGKHQFEYEIDNEFFEHFEYDEFNSANLKVDLILDKKTTMMELTFKTSGTVNIFCDLTNEPYDQPIESTLFLVVKFGEEYNDDNEDLLILPHGEFEVNVQQYIYELVVLAVPSKRVHPGVIDGSLQSEVLEKLEELTPKEKEMKAEEEIDPRWNKLKNLLNDK
ncbi:YceD family protein [Salinimicrobium soli]|uniref:YceD family protein n=1 Tax=Salinimicrobium soli TaxID=1254399 RepID=UPI003AACC6BC